MQALAAWLGTLLGTALAQCAPVLAEILAEGFRRAMRETAEDGTADDALRTRLLQRVHQNDLRQAGGTCEAEKDDPGGSSLGT